MFDNPVLILLKTHELHVMKLTNMFIIKLWHQSRSYDRSNDLNIQFTLNDF